MPDETTKPYPSSPALSSPGQQQPIELPLSIPKIEGYTITGILGQGGMGAVWRAVQLGTRRDVALKLMGDLMPESPIDRARFQREVELAARLDHPNIARVYDSGLDRGVYFYAMELIEGEDLERYVRRRDLPQPGILRLIRLVCGAVEHAHQHGVIHRDLKPSNILVTESGQPYVLDFGLAKGLWDTDQELLISRDGQCAGTLAYMSPEQAAGGSDGIDTRADIYTLGVILYRLVTEQFPHDLSTAGLNAYRRITQEEVRRPSRITQTVNTELESLLLKTLAKDPEDRYASVGQLAQDIDNYLTGEPLIAQPPTVGYVLRKHLRKHRVSITVTAAILLGIFTLIGIGYWRERHLRQIAVKELEAKRWALYRNQIALAQNYIPNHIDTAQRILDACPEDLRHWEWRYLRHLTDQSIFTMGPHPGAIVSVAFIAGLEADPQAEDCHRYIASADHRVIHIWDAATGQQVRSIERTAADPRGVAFSPSTRRAATVDGTTIKLWDIETTSVLQTITQPSQPPAAVAFGPDGSTLIWADPDGAVLWDIETAQALHTFKGHAARVNTVAASPDNRYLAVGGQTQSSGTPPRKHGVVTLWAMDSGELILSIPNLDAPVESLAFSSDGDTLAVGTREAVTFWDLTTGQALNTLPTTGYALAFSPDDRHFASSGSRSTVTIWDMATLTATQTLHGHKRFSVQCLAFSDDGRQLVSGSGDATVKLWAPTSTRDTVSFGLGPSLFAISRDGQWAAGTSTSETNQGGVSLWQTYPQGNHLTLGQGQLMPRAAVWSPDAEHLLIVSGAGDPKATLWDVQSGAAVRSFDGGFPFFVFSPDSRFIAAPPPPQATPTPDTSIRIWRSDTGEEVASFPSGHSSIRWIAFSPDGDTLVTAGDDSMLRVWDLDSRQVIRTIPWDSTDKTVILKAEVSADAARIVAEDLQRRVKLWDLHTGREIGALPHHRSTRSWALSGDGRLLAQGGYGWIKLFDTRSGDEIVTLHGHQEFVQSLAFSPDNLRLASGGDDTIVKLWDTMTGAEVVTLRGHRAGVTALAFSDDGQRLASASQEDGVVRLWRAPGNDALP